MSPQPKVILVVFDGCRPDALAQVDTPALDGLMRAGASTLSAQTVMPSWSLPTHMSMFRAVAPELHGVRDNTFQLSARAYPSIVDLAHDAGLRTAMFYSWDELRDLAAPGSLDLGCFRNCYTSAEIDAWIAGQAAAQLVAGLPDFTFVYLCETDLLGHVHGWMSGPYLEAVARMDRALGGLIAALQRAGLAEQVTWLVLADHGGHDHTHGSDCAEDMTIPWILSGAGIKRGHAIQAPVRIVDTAATIAHLLGLERPANWQGQPVREALHE